MNYLEIIGVVVGLIYLYWEYRANALLWLAGIVMPAIYIIVYYDAGFYADMAINIYYLAASLYGLWFWLRKSEGGQARTITHTPRKYIAPCVVVSVVLWVSIWWVLDRFTDSTVAVGDSFTTALSVVGLWLLSRKYLEQWLVWIAVDVVCAVLYLQKDLAPTGWLYALYTIIAIFGYYKWRKMMRDDTKK
ncbi:MAG: nicotinamide riboside transporter PnuC [Mucinivorans sp.]